MEVLSGILASHEAVPQVLEDRRLRSKPVSPNFLGPEPALAGEPGEVFRR